MKSIFRTASFFFILSLFVAPKVFAQPLPPHVLFESFTNSNEPCPDPSRAPYESAVVSTATSEATKIVYLNYHVSNLSDQLSVLDPEGSLVDGRLSGATTGSVLYTSAVNRSIFPQTGERIDPPTTGSGSYSDWGTQIDADYTTSPEASITFNYATLDKSSSQSYKLHLDLTVTANQSISDSLIIRYAVTQDNVKWAECGSKSNTTFNNVVWSITTANTSNYIVCTPAASMNTGATAHMTADISVDLEDTAFQKPANMKVVAFLEDDGGGDYNVVNADILRQDIDTLQPPPPTLSFNESYISGDTLNPGSPQPAEIYYVSTNLPNGVMVYYSLDNGTTWRYIENSTSAYGPANWTVPDSLTTHGKIKLVAVGDTSLISIEKGTFTIANPPSVTILKPQAGQVIKGGSSDTIVWTNVSVTANTLEYYLAEADGDFVTPHVLGTNLTDTSFVWAVPDTARTVEIKIVPINDEAPAVTVVDTIEGGVVIPPSSVATSSTPTSLTITNVFPNPASNGQEIVVQYSEPQPKPITIQLLDLLGHIMPETYTTDNLAIHLNTSSLEAGAYVVRLSDGTTTVSKRVEIIR